MSDLIRETEAISCIAELLIENGIPVYRAIEIATSTRMRQEQPHD